MFLLHLLHNDFHRAVGTANSSVGVVVIVVVAANNAVTGLAQVATKVIRLVQVASAAQIALWEGERVSAAQPCTKSGLPCTRRTPWSTQHCSEHLCTAPAA